MTDSALECARIPTPSESSSQFLTDPLDIRQPYDAWVLAGGRLFRAHANVLCAHSPYLRASIAALGEARLLLPHIPAAGFSAVLAFMYTGRLSHTQVPVYEILLTGHLLQMQNIIGLCQVLLSTPTTTHPSSLLNYDATGTLAPLPPALNTWRNLARLVPPVAGASAPVQAQPTLVRPTPTRPTNLPPFIEKQPEEPQHRPLVLNDKRGLLHAERYIFCQYKKTSSLATSSFDQLKSTKPKSSSVANVVVDIAACDGPVFFERVINKAFKNNSDRENLTDSDDSEINVVDTTMTAADPTTFDDQNQEVKCSRPQVANGCRTYHCVYCNNTFKSHYCYQKHMRRHINPITIEENSQRTEVDKESEPSSKNAVEESQKETTKFVTSIAPVAGCNIKCLAMDDCSIPSSGSSIGTARDENDSKLKVLDLNVQYFPCKTCGSKFPSYYFVHKHRRLCHGEDEDDAPAVKDTSSCSFDSNSSKKSEDDRERPTSDK